MEIFFSDIPEEGLPISGKLAASLFGLTEEDSIRVSGDFEYDLTLYSFDEVIVFSGSVAGPVELQCVTCLEFFQHEIYNPAWQSEYDIEENQVSFDPRESLRDEIILSFPSTPHCDEMVESKVCEKAGLLAKFEHDEQPLEAEEEPGDDVWGALDQLGENQ